MKCKTLNQKLKTFILILLIPLAFTTQGCSSDDSNSDDDNAPLDCYEMTSFITEYLDTVEDFQMNPNEQTCDDLRNSALDFIELIENCPQFGSEFSDYEEAVQEWTNLDCSEF